MITTIVPSNVFFQNLAVLHQSCPSLHPEQVCDDKSTYSIWHKRHCMTSVAILEQMTEPSLSPTWLPPSLSPSLTPFSLTSVFQMLWNQAIMLWGSPSHTEKCLHMFLLTLPANISVKCPHQFWTYESTSLQVALVLTPPAAVGVDELSLLSAAQIVDSWVKQMLALF